MENKKNKIKIITPFWNASDYIGNCVNSVMSQKYDNYQVIFIDDCSTDDSWDKLPYNDEKAICIKNTIRKTALENIHLAIMNHCEIDDIVVLVDGDDMLSSKKALSIINDLYNEYNPWILYGQAIWSDGRKGIARPFPNQEALNQLRKVVQAFHYLSHIRTFRAGLYHKIKEQDNEFKCLKDNSGEFYKSAYDACIFIPLLELAGFDKIYYNDKSLYWYNRGNPLNDDKQDQGLQTGTHLEVMKKSPFKQIESYK